VAPRNFLSWQSVALMWPCELSVSRPSRIVNITEDHRDFPISRTLAAHLLIPPSPLMNALIDVS
jgi:hypothetical protein